MPVTPAPEPFHSPIGLSQEYYRTSRRWLWLLVAVVVALGAGLVLLLFR